MSKKQRVSTPANDEKQELGRKHGRILCDNMANSLKKNSISGYKHVYPRTTKGTYFFQATVYDIEFGKLL